MTLYYVNCRSDDCEPLAMLVVADSVDEAGQLVVDYWAEDRIELDPDGKIFAFAVPPIPTTTGVIEWHDMPVEDCVVTLPDTSGWWED
jgi:hypothetical protein